MLSTFDERADDQIINTENKSKNLDKNINN